MNSVSAGTRIACLALIGGLAGAAAQAADFQIYTSPHFTGAEITLKGETPDVTPLTPFSDQAASLVLTGRWEVCTEPNFRGQCVVLGPGRYPTLSAPIYQRIGSLRPLGARIAEDERRQRDERLALEQRTREERLVHDERRAREQRARQDRLAHEERIAREERARQDRLAHEERIAREERFAREQARRDAIVAERERSRYPRGSIDLYPHPDFRGRPLHFDRDVASLEEHSDRASSLVVHEGRWQVCSEAHFQGKCRVYEPGRYELLGRLDNHIASLRLLR